MTPDEFQDILYEKDEETGIVTVTINKPERKNAMSSLTFLELYWAVDHMENDDSAQIMILTGAKDPNSNDPKKEAFSSGGYFNLNALDSISAEAKKEIDHRDIAQKKLTVKMWQFDKPVIAAVNGLSIGAGFTMLISCADLIYASEYAWFRLPFINLGIVPEFSITNLLPRLVGFQKAKEIIFFGEKLTAQKLYDLGIVNQVVPHGELLDHARKMALKLIPPNGAGLAVRLTKRALHKPLVENISTALDLENEGLNEAFATEDFIEGMVARQEKRAPVYKGK